MHRTHGSVLRSWGSGHVWWRVSTAQGWAQQSRASSDRGLEASAVPYVSIPSRNDSDVLRGEDALSLPHLSLDPACIGPRVEVDHPSERNFSFSSGFRGAGFGASGALWFSRYSGHGSGPEVPCKYHYRPQSLSFGRLGSRPRRVRYSRGLVR